VANWDIKVDFDSEVPIFVQVKNQLRLLIDRGQIVSGAQLPTVRDLAVTLEINANTVSRIYADLEREGYIARKRGIGTFAVNQAHREESDTPGKAHLKETLRQLRSLGYSDRQIIEMTGEILSEDEE
jgi:GntR family transcriptional regulator